MCGKIIKTEFFFFFIFFFKQKTAYEILTCDWSSDVCSSDLFKDVLTGVEKSSRTNEAVLNCVGW